MFYPYNDILLRKEKEQAMNIFSSMDKTQNIILSGRSQTQKTTYFMISFI